MNETNETNGTKDVVQETITRNLDNLQTDVKILQTDVTNIREDIGWIKGKLEGGLETKHIILTAISAVAAIAAVIVAIAAIVT